MCAAMQRYGSVMVQRCNMCKPLVFPTDITRHAKSGVRGYRGAPHNLATVAEVPQ